MRSRIPRVRAAPCAKRREPPAAGCVRWYERHPCFLFVKLFCCSVLLVLSLVWSLWAYGVSLCSCLVGVKKSSYLLVLCVSIRISAPFEKWLFCCKCLNLLFSLREMIKCVLWICWSVRCCGFPTSILVLKVSVWLSVGSFGPEGHRPAVWKKKRRLLQESLSEGFSWNRILTHVCFLSADITHSMPVCVHKPAK